MQLSVVDELEPALVQQIFYIAERKREANVLHNRQANNLRAAVKALEGVAFCQRWTLRNRPTHLNQILPENTHPIDIFMQIGL